MSEHEENNHAVNNHHSLSKIDRDIGMILLGSLNKQNEDSKLVIEEDGKTIEQDKPLKDRILSPEQIQGHFAYDFVKLILQGKHPKDITVNNLYEAAPSKFKSKTEAAETLDQSKTWLLENSSAAMAWLICKLVENDGKKEVVAYLNTLLQDGHGVYTERGRKTLAHFKDKVLSHKDEHFYPDATSMSFLIKHNLPMFVQAALQSRHSDEILNSDANGLFIAALAGGWNRPQCLQIIATSHTSDGPENLYYLLFQENNGLLKYINDFDGQILSDRDKEFLYKATARGIASGILSSSGVKAKAPEENIKHLSGILQNASQSNKDPYEITRDIYLSIFNDPKYYRLLLTYIIHETEPSELTARIAKGVFDDMAQRINSASNETDKKTLTKQFVELIPFSPSPSKERFETLSPALSVLFDYFHKEQATKSYKDRKNATLNELDKWLKPMDGNSNIADSQYSFLPAALFVTSITDEHVRKNTWEKLLDDVCNAIGTKRNYKDQINDLAAESPQLHREFHHRLSNHISSNATHISTHQNTNLSDQRMKNIAWQASLKAPIHADVDEHRKLEEPRQTPPRSKLQQERQP